MQTYYIYKATNLCNGKIYIGRTSNFFGRLRTHVQKVETQDDNYFHQALRKYGIKNFVWQIIDTADSKQHAREREEELIIEYNSLAPNGYNVSRGEASLTLSVPVVQLTLDGKFVKRFFSINETAKDGFSPPVVQRVCRNKGYSAGGYVFMFEQEYLKKGPKKYRKPKPYQAQTVIQCDMSGNFIEKFNSIKDASIKTGATRSGISNCVIGKQKSANGFIFVKEEDYPIKNLENHEKKRKGRRVAAVDLKTGEIVKRFDRLIEAGEYCGCDFRQIHAVIDQPDRSAHGYRWISQ